MNKAILIGRVGHTPEIINTDGGKFAKCSLATSERYTKDGEKKEITDWHNLVINGKLVDVVERFVTKGKQIYVEGRIRYRKYTGKDGVEKTTTEIMVSNIELLGGGDAPQSAQDAPGAQKEWRVNYQPLDDNDPF